MLNQYFSKNKGFKNGNKTCVDDLNVYLYIISNCNKMKKSCFQTSNNNYKLLIFKNTCLYSLIDFNDTEIKKKTLPFGWSTCMKKRVPTIMLFFKKKKN